MSTYYIAGIPYSDELYHHGIKGQKWGVRRYQNEDGSYTPAGKKRYSDGASGNASSKSGGIDKEKLKKAAKIAAVAAGTGLAAYGAYRFANSDAGRNLVSGAASRIRSSAEGAKARKDLIKDSSFKNVRKMDNAELLEKIGRLENEQKYIDLVIKSLTNSSDPAKKAMIDAGKKVAPTILSGVGLYTVKAVLERKVNPKEAAGYIAPKPKNK